MSVPRRRRAALLLAAAASSGCPAEHPPIARPQPAPAEAKARFAHDPSALHRSLDHYHFAAHPDLLQRIAASPFQYFRFTNPGFAAAIYATFEDILPALPTVNLHGDAHLEQFAVTDASFGLVDFDDAVGGPAVIDLLRFGVSLERIVSLPAGPSAAAERLPISTANVTANARRHEGMRSMLCKVSKRQANDGSARVRLAGPLRLTARTPDRPAP